jgi:hypothetical protein
MGEGVKDSRCGEGSQGDEALESWTPHAAARRSSRSGSGRRPPRPKRGAAWRSNEVVASGLYAALDTHLLRDGAGTAAPAIQPAEQGFGDSADPCIVGAAADDADCHICMPRCHGSWV